MTQGHSQVVDDNAICVNSFESDFRTRAFTLPDMTPNDRSVDKIALVEIPLHFRRQKGPRGKQRIKRFEYERYNVGILINFSNSMCHIYVILGDAIYRTGEQYS